MTTPEVTIVVCTYNRADRLRGALESLAALELGAHTAEILVVDNNSTDDTDRVARDVAGTSQIPLRIVRERMQGIVPARNRGIAEAAGEWIAFFDDDQLAEPDWIAQLLEAAKRHDVHCVGGAVDLRLPEEFRGLRSHVVRMLLGETVGMHTERRYNRRVTPGCGNLLIHRNVFDCVGVFDPKYADRGEDTDLWQRILDARFTGWFTPKARVHHVIPRERLETSFLLQLAVRMAEGMAEDERHASGARYPFVWAARIGQLALVLWPRLLWAVLRGDRDRALGARCRLSMAKCVLRDGLRLMFQRDPNSSVPTPREEPSWPMSRCEKSTN